MKTSLTLFMTLTLLISILGVSLQIQPAQAQTVIRVIPDTLEFGPEDVVGQEFMIAVAVENVADIVGLDVQFSWNTTTTYLEYINHTRTITVEDYPAPIPPSPYPGIIHESTVNFSLRDDIDPPELGPGTYWAAYSQILPLVGFNGNGTVFVMAFNITAQPLPGEADVTLNLEILVHDLSDSTGTPISNEAINGTVVLHAPAFEYPAWPLLKIVPDDISDVRFCNNFTVDVYLMGDGQTDLDPFWDISGIDVTVNFNATLLAPSGQGRLFSVTFHAIYESTSFPPPSAPITLANPIVTLGALNLDALDGLIDPADPVGTEWSELAPDFGTTPYLITDWVDNGDGTLSPGDQIMIDHPDGFYFDHHVDYVTGTMKVTQQPFPYEEELLAMDGPYGMLSTTAPFDGYGVANWTGTFQPTYPVVSVNYINVTPQIGAPYQLVEGLDFVVNPEGTITLLTGLDEQVLNEYVGNMSIIKDTGQNGWPGLGGYGNWYTMLASSIQSVYIDMNNGTARYASNAGYGSGADYEGPMPPGMEWWYDPDWPSEIESWWATGAIDDPAWTWPNATDIWVNYTAPAFIYIDYVAGDPVPRYIEFEGTYDEFLAARTGPENSSWNEVYRNRLRSYDLLGWTDEGDGFLGADDTVLLFDGAANATYIVNRISTDIVVSQKPWICEEDPADPFFGVAPIVAVAGFPQPNTDLCPWHNHEYSVPIPHVVEDGEYTAPFRPLGGFIDIFVCNYEEGFKGEGKDAPADMFWPQKEVMLCANVTYAGWPEQNKDVAFEIKFPNGTVYVVMYNRTNSVGFAFVRVRLPWPCDDPESIFGVWKVWGTVDVACVVVNDTMEFKYDYRIRIFDVVADKDEYKHCEDITVSITYGTYSMQEFDIVFTLTVTDASGVPIGFAYMQVTVGGAVWCQYAMGELELSVHVVKWARPPLGTIYVGGLSDFPQNGGSAETPVYISYVTILPEWA